MEIPRWKQWGPKSILKSDNVLVPTGDNPYYLNQYWCYMVSPAKNYTGSIFCLLFGVSSDYAQPITGQVLKLPALWLAEHSLSLLEARDRKQAQTGSS